jgi:N-acetylglucosaminyldiphosphoundecaprenol N-acetyl-beta-D-mannosaminyltransferase
MAIAPLATEDRARVMPAAPTGDRVRHLRHRCELAGVLIDQVDVETAVARIEQFLRSDGAHQVVTVNLDFLSIAQRNILFRETINRSDLAVPDGMPLVWMSRLNGYRIAERVTGVTLVGESCRLAAESGLRPFLLGAGPGVADAAARTLQERYPELQIAGTYSPPFGPFSTAENDRMVAAIREAETDLLFVAFGAPLQDIWIREHLSQLNVRMAMGVGCALDLLAGTVRRAPGWMQRSGLEWSYRLLQEPRRLWRRYLIDDVPMLGRLVVSSVRRDQAATPRTQPAAKRPA